MRFQGPAFASYKNPPTAHADSRQRYTFRGAHTNTRAALRNLRHACKRILESKDAHVQAQVARVEKAVEKEPMPEFGKLHLIFSALDACDQTGEPWHVCMKYLMDKFEDMEADRVAAEA
jgi:hypothetical protein